MCPHKNGSSNHNQNALRNLVYMSQPLHRTHNRTKSLAHTHQGSINNHQVIPLLFPLAGCSQLCCSGLTRRQKVTGEAAAPVALLC